MSPRRLLALSLLVPLLALPATPADARSAPNLKLAKVTSSTARVQAFGSFTVTATVARTGRVPAGLRVEYLLSKNTRRDAADVPLLGVRQIPRGAGRSTTTTWVTTFGLTKPGRYHVLACADLARDLKESNERDNCASTRATVTVTAAPTGKTKTVTTALAGSRRRSLELFLRGVDRFGTESGQVTATGADGTRYTLAVPQDAALMSLPLTITPVSSVGGLPGAPRVMGVKIEPESDLMRSATLTIRPGKPLSPSRALPAAYDGHGAGVRLTPMTSKPGVFTFPLTHLGGVLLIEGANAARRVAGRRPATAAGASTAATGMGAKDLFSWTPPPRVSTAKIAEAVAFEQKLQQSSDAWDGGEAQAAIMEAQVQAILADARAAIASVNANPTIGQFNGAMRLLMDKWSFLQVMGADEDQFRALSSLLAPAYEQVRHGVHACDDGMGDVLGTALLRANNDIAQAWWNLPRDTDTACTKFRAHVSVAEHSAGDDDFQAVTDYSAGITWQPKDILNYTDQPEDGTFTTATFHDVCQHGEGPLSPEQPWNLVGLNVDWDALFQDGLAWPDQQRSPFALDAYLGTAIQAGVLDDPGCDQAFPVTYGYGGSPQMRMAYASGIMSGERVEDDTSAGTSHRQLSYDLTPVK